MKYMPRKKSQKFDKNEENYKPIPVFIYHYRNFSIITEKSKAFFIIDSTTRPTSPVFLCNDFLFIDPLYGKF